MTRSSLLVLMLAAACGRPDPQAEAAPLPPISPIASPSAPPKPDPVAKGVPHGGQITQVAVTENADAALTVDNTGGVRLWPALDGSRTPVPIPLVAPDQLGLAHAGRDLFATILDEAGSVRLMRLGRDGSVRGDVQLPSEVAYTQVIALDDGAIVRTEDQAIEWFSPDGESRGRLVAEPARRIQAIAARRGRAVAIITDGTKHEMRWLLMLGGKLTWGAGVELPTSVKGDLVALSPTHRRFAVVDAASTVQVYELGLVPTRIGNTLFGGDAADLGFIDEDHIAVMGRSMLWWVMPQKPGNDPWAVASPAMPTPSTMQFMQGGAIADGLAVTGFGAAISLTTKEKAQYLGYKEHGVGNVVAGPSSLSLTMTGSHFVWLDDKLAVKRELELRKEPTSPWIYGTPVGDHHVVTQSPFANEYKVELLDLDNLDKPVKLGTWPVVDRIEFSPDTNLLGVNAGKTIHRFKLDLAANTATELTPVRTRGSMVTMRLFDPERADGITAVSVGWWSDYDEDYTLTIYRAKGKAKHVRHFNGRVIDIDASGNIYVAKGDEIEVRRGDQKVSSFKFERLGSAIGVTADGSRYAVTQGNDVVVLDANGTEQWRKFLWGTQQLVFTKDGKQLAVRANGGLIMLDAASGERTAMECGWSFALTTIPPPTNALVSAPVCEDPML